jgi:hypothetical protein
MRLILPAVLFSLLAPAVAFAQPELIEPEQAAVEEPPAKKSVEEQLRELREERKAMERQLGAFDDRIRALEAQVGVPPEPPAPVTAHAPTAGARTSQSAAATLPEGTPASGKGGFAGFMERKEASGAYEAGKGFLIVRDEEAELGAGVFAYARYLNQRALDKTYTDAFGRTHDLADIRQDVQFQKLSWNFKGWLFDPNFRYYFFFWTSNPQMGEGAQVVLGGYFQYRFADWLTVTMGVMPLPTTRTTNYTFPNWLRNDNRIMADEFFRGSYSTGIDAMGEITPGLRYRVAIANNLAQLGVSSQELDYKFNTVSGAVWWMPTTHEFGPASGMGDFEEHQELATLFGAHFTRSREDAQGQPDINDFENSQIRLSDGTLLFSPDPFGTGGKVEKATYMMAAFNAGMKYQGWHFEGEYYFRWVNDMKTIGFIPDTSLFDHGFSLQGSSMVIPQLLQAYVTGSMIFGEYGDPWELALGMNIYPFKRKEVRFNLQGLWLNHSPVGGSSLPSQVGGNGWVFSTDLIVNF